MLNKLFIAEWRDAKKLWSMRVVAFWTIFWSALVGLWALLPAFIGYVPAPVLAGLSIVMAVSIGLARLLKQPGADL